MIKNLFVKSVLENKLDIRRKKLNKFTAFACENAWVKIVKTLVEFKLFGEIDFIVIEIKHRDWTMHLEWF